MVRLDTFSKTIAPGCRLGWITTQPNLCERLLRITETSTQQPSGFVQSMVAELIMGPHDPKHGRGGGRSHGGWQVDGWVRWLQGLRGNYERRMQTMCSILDGGKELVRSGRRKSIDNEWSVVDKVTLFDFTWPLGGMFVWSVLLVLTLLVSWSNAGQGPSQLSLSPSMEHNHARQACTRVMGPFDHGKLPGAGWAWCHILSDR